jgi:murein DD-endopeptidase MepM/ murein hydrolase activator NlpD
MTMTQRIRRRTGATGLLAVAVATVIGLMAGVPAAADDLDDQRAQAEAQQAATEAALAGLQAEMESTEAALVQAVAELAGIQAAIPVAQQQLDAAEEELARLQREAEILAQRLAAAQAEEQAITAQIAANTARAAQIQVAIGRMAREAYRGDMAATSLTAVLDANSAEDFVEQSALSSAALRTQTQALRELDQLNGVNRNQEVRLEAVRVEIGELKEEADARVAEAEVVRQQAAERRAELDVLLAQAEEKRAFVEAKRAEEAATFAELQAQEAQLEADLAEIIRQQDAARAAAGQNPIGSTASQPFTNPTSINPIHLTSAYGMRFHPVYRAWRMHNGIDLRTYCGNPIYAGTSGTVQWARYRSGYGNQVLVNHGYWNGSSLMSSYNHMSSFAVSSGQNVSQGQLLGYSGNTGTSAGCHLHFEVYLNGATVDPWPLIAK